MKVRKRLWGEQREGEWGRERKRGVRRVREVGRREKGELLMLFNNKDENWKIYVRS